MKLVTYLCSAIDVTKRTDEALEDGVKPYTCNASVDLLQIYNTHSERLKISTQMG